MASASMTLSEL